MKLKSVIMALLLIAVIVFSGCDLIKGGSTKVNSNYFKGTKGIEMSFKSGLPPSKIYEGDKFHAVLDIRNLGSYPDKGAPEGRLFISGFDKNAINGYWENYDYFPKSLPGKTPLNPTGGHATKVYKDREVRVPFDNEKYSATVQVTACYKYRTTATPVVCIDPEPGNRIPDKPCRPQVVSMSGGQGAPVAVTKVEPRISSEGIYFTIYIQNVGKGKVISTSKYSSCPFNVDYNDINKVLVQASLPYDSSPECTPTGTNYNPVILSNSGSGAITCRFNNPGGQAYKTPLKIRIDYVYSSSIKKDIEILNLDYLR